MANHVVSDGEYLVALAAKYGFQSYETIWNHPKNAALKALRKNPNVLLPGDVVFIPDKQERTVSSAPDRAHKFVLKRDRQRLRMKVSARFAAPTPVDEAKVLVDGSERTVPVSDGLIDLEIPRAARAGAVRLGEREIPFVLGTLDPLDEPSGLRQRLTNLGFDAGEILPPLDDIDDEDLRDRMRLADEQLRWAIEEAQLAGAQRPNGEADASFQSLLEELHGV